MDQKQVDNEILNKTSPNPKERMNEILNKISPTPIEIMDEFLGILKQATKKIARNKNCLVKSLI